MLAWLVLALVLAAPSAPAASGPFALLYSFSNPRTNAQGGAQQGASVAMDGNFAVVGAPYDRVGGTNSGAVTVYDATTGAALYALTNPSPAVRDYFGSAVAVSGTRVLVGAYGDDTGANDSGRAYAYDLAGAAPLTPVVTLANPAPASGDSFGYSVAIAGDWAVVGAYLDNAGVNDGGSAYVYNLASANPDVPALILTNPAPAGGDQFGWSVAISGPRVMVGTYRSSTGTADLRSSYVFDLTSANPAIPVVTLTNPVPAFQSYFGTTVAISDARAVVGKSKEPAGGYILKGRVYVYDLAGSAPSVPVLTLTNPNPPSSDYFGSAVAISGTRLIAGVGNDNTEAQFSGRAYVYDLAGSNPLVPIITLTNPGPAANDYFGNAVAISGTRGMVGAIGDDQGATDAGNAYLYDFAGVVPTGPVAALINPNPSPYDLFGRPVAISGTRIVIAADLDDTGATDAGLAYVYDLAGSSPTVPMVTLTNPAPQNGDHFGFAAAISGTRVVVGAYLDDTSHLDAGIAYVFDVAGSTPTIPVLVLSSPSPFPDQHFGRSVAISGKWVAVGAPEALVGFNTVGEAYVYDLEKAAPAIPALVLTNPAPAEGDAFGFSLAISGTLLVVGARLDGLLFAGAAYVYDLGGATSTVPMLVLTNPSPALSDSFGYSVAISGTLVVVGAPGDQLGTLRVGAAYVYDTAGATPAVPFLTLTNPTPSQSDQFGSSVAISGLQVIIGDFRDDNGAADAGSAYVYDLANAVAGVPVDTLNKPNPGTNEQFGYSVAIDGTTIIVSAHLVDSIVPDMGAAYVFGLTPKLSIVLAMPGFATVSWTPTNAPGFVLQQTDLLAPTTWVNAPNGASSPVAVSTTNAARFYRLASP